MTRNRCGNCTACCKTVGVTDIAKPPNKWCDKCDIGKGCTIYDIRPASCAAFECFWFSNEWIHGDLRPDRCKVVFEGMQEANAVVAMVDPDRPDAYKSKTVWPFIRWLVGRMGIAVVVMHGPDKKREAVFVLPEGRTQEDVMQGMERYGRASITRFAEQEGLSFEDALAQYGNIIQ